MSHEATTSETRCVRKPQADSVQVAIEYGLGDCETVYTAIFRQAVRAYLAWEAKIPAHPDRAQLHTAMIRSIEALNCDEFTLYQEWRTALLEKSKGVSKQNHKVIFESAGVPVSW